MSQPGLWYPPPPPKTMLGRLTTVKDERRPEHIWPRAMLVWTLNQITSRASSVWFVWQDGCGDSWLTVDVLRNYEERTEPSCLLWCPRQRLFGLGKPKPKSSLMEKTMHRWDDWTVRMIEMAYFEWMDACVLLKTFLTTRDILFPTKDPPCDKTSRFCMKDLAMHLEWNML